MSGLPRAEAQRRGEHLWLSPRLTGLTVRGPLRRGAGRLRAANLENPEERLLSSAAGAPVRAAEDDLRRRGTSPDKVWPLCCGPGGGAHTGHCSLPPRRSAGALRPTLQFCPRPGRQGSANVHRHPLGPSPSPPGRGEGAGEGWRLLAGPGRGSTAVWEGARQRSGRLRPLVFAGESGSTSPGRGRSVSEQLGVGPEARVAPLGWGGGFSVCSCEEEGFSAGSAPLRENGPIAPGRPRASS